MKKNVAKGKKLETEAMAEIELALLLNISIIFWDELCQDCLIHRSL